MNVNMDAFDIDEPLDMSNDRIDINDEIDNNNNKRKKRKSSPKRKKRKSSPKRNKRKSSPKRNKRKLARQRSMSPQPEIRIGSKSKEGYFSRKDLKTKDERDWFDNLDSDRKKKQYLATQRHTYKQQPFFNRKDNRFYKD